MAEPGAATGVEERAAFRPAGDAPVRVLVVDDESGVRNAISRVLRHAGMLPTTADNGASALQLLDREPFDVALLDVRMPGMTGQQLLSRIKSARYAAEVIMMTAFADIATTVSAVKEGAYGFLTKPFVANESILIEVLNAASHKRLRERTESLQRELAELRPSEAVQCWRARAGELDGRSPSNAGEMVGLCTQMGEDYRVISGVAKADSIERALVLDESDAIAASSLPPELATRANQPRTSSNGDALGSTSQAAQPYQPSPTSLEDVVAALSLHELAYPEAKRRVLAEFTEAYVTALLHITGGNMSEAARRSGLDRSNFRRLLRPRPASADPPADGDD